MFKQSQLTPKWSKQFETGIVGRVVLMRAKRTYSGIKHPQIIFL
jgi:hypothetical protein